MYSFIAIDFETADPQRDSACAIGLARVEGAEIVRKESRLIRPPRPVVHPACQAVHGLSWPQLKDQPLFVDVFPDLANVFVGIDTLVAHNAPFDRSVLETCCREAQIELPPFKWVCTLGLARQTQSKPHDLKTVCGRLGVTLTDHHEAGADAEAAARVLIALEGRKGSTTERDRILASVFARARTVGKTVYAYTTDYASCAPFRNPTDVPAECDRLCVDGDPDWIALPRFEYDLEGE